ncbi:MAG: DUF6263 family protein [Phycisphaerales bacterium]
MRRTALTLASAAFLASSALAADSANLGPTFTKGEKARYELANTVTQVINAPQGEINVEVKNTLVLACEVTEIDSEDGGAIVTATIESIKADFTSPMFSDGFDSSKPAEEDVSSQLAPFIRPIVGQSFTVDFDAGGANADIRGVDRLLPQNQQAAQMVAQAINAQALGTSVVGFYVLKDGDEMIPVGEQWSDSQTEQTPLGSITITTNFTLEGIEDSVAKVVVDGDAKFSPAAESPSGSMDIDESEIGATLNWNTDQDMLRDSQTRTMLLLSMITNPATPEVKQTVRIVNTASAKRLD